MNISERLKNLRKKQKLSVVECANFIGVSQSTYRDWENGRSISGEPYIKIANLFGVSLSELFGLKELELSAELKELNLVLEQASNHIKSIRSRL